MDDAWPEDDVFCAIRKIMGEGEGSQTQPWDVISECHESVGAAITSQLGVERPHPRTIDELIKRILRTALEKRGDEPTAKALRSLLGFCADADVSVELARHPHHRPSAKLIENGYRSKQMRLWLAGRYQRPPIGIRRASGRQKAWAGDMVGILYEFLHFDSATAREIADELGLESKKSSQVSDAHQQISSPPPTVAEDPVAYLIDFSEELETALNAARNACIARKRPYYTTHTLLALLDMPNGHVRDCFNYKTNVDWAQEIRRRLLKMHDDDTRSSSEIPKVNQLDEAKLAWRRYAVSDDKPVDEFRLLLAILDGNSETNRQLKEILGQQYAQVRAAADQGRKDGKRPKTPSW